MTLKAEKTIYNTDRHSSSSFGFIRLFSRSRCSILPSHHIHESLLWSSFLPPAWLLHLEQLSTFIYIYISIYPYTSHLSTSPNNFNPASNVVSKTADLFRSRLVTPEGNLNIFNSVTSTSVSWVCISATVSKPNNITGFSSLLGLFHFTFAATLLSFCPEDPFHLCCTSTFIPVLSSTYI